MAKIKRSELPRTVAFNQIHQESQQIGERNDCAVKALALLAKIPYAEAHALLAAKGRKNGDGTYTHWIVSALRELGHTVSWRHSDQFIAQYPKAHKVLKGVTSHHMDRFNKVWANGKSYLCLTQNHVFAVIDGVNHDWTRGRALRVVEIYEVS